MQGPEDAEVDDSGGADSDGTSDDGQDGYGQVHDAPDYSESDGVPLGEPDNVGPAGY